MIRFDIGSIVHPVWDDTARGMVIGVDGLIRKVEWTKDGQQSKVGSDTWHESNLKAVRIDTMSNTIRCKPVPVDLEIEEGGWKYVIVNRHTDKIIAAFVSEYDAEQYAQQFSGVFLIREVDWSQ